jgi:C4-type Zn-finger protein
MGAFCSVVEVQNISSCSQQCKRTWSPCRLPYIFRTVLSKSGICRQILMKVSNIKSTKIRPLVAESITAEGHDEALHALTRK